MKRDLTLIRRILNHVEEQPAGQVLTDITYPDYASATVYEHVELLIEAGFIKGQVSKSDQGITTVRIDRLTWEGHNFRDKSQADRYI